MQLELGILPSGHLHSYSTESNKTAKQSPLDVDINNVFLESTASGLLLLAAQDDATVLSPVLAYWRSFACQYLSERCLLVTPDPTDPAPIAGWHENRLTDFLAGIPPMRGAEYLSTSTLSDLWFWFDDWICEQIRQYGSLALLLKSRAPRWHQVGRVCFHLAENKQDDEYPFAFMATYAPESTTLSPAKVRHRPLATALQEYAGAGNKQALIHLLSPVQLASGSSPLVAELVNSGDLYHPLAWTPQEAYAFLKETPVYEHCGISVRLPDWWKKRSRPQVSVTIGSSKQSLLGKDTLLDFKMDMVLGDQRLTHQELTALQSAQDGLIFIKGQWVEVDKQRLNEALEHWKKVEAGVAEAGISFAEGMRLLAGAPADLKQATSLDDEQSWDFVQPGRWLKNLLDELSTPQALKAITPGKLLKADLRAYQQTGVNWLWLLSQIGLGACLADDMGLGKTMQILALLLIIKKHEQKLPSLLVLPASLLGNWQAELQQFAPTLNGLFIHSSKMTKADITALGQSADAGLEKVDLVLTTYGMLSRQPWLESQHWNLLILDEAQAIKNPSSRQTRAVKKIKAKARIALTGTPVENRIGDLWSLFDFLNPGLLGSANAFKRFIKDLAARKHDQYAPLRHLTQPYILRRLKTDKRIISDLPEKTELHAWCGLSREQAMLYQKEVNNLASALKTQQGIKRRGLVLASLVRLKQICNHPSQLLADGIYKPANSGKFKRLAELCVEIASRQEKLLVFTQFREIIEPLADFLAIQFDRTGLILHGGTAVKKRKQLVDEFQHEDGPPFFILSLKAGGTGLNLTAASHVIHFDRWWNPAVENQATDRAFRIGQKNNVLVHKFVCQGTVEEKIDALISDKSRLADELIEGQAETLLTEMNNEQLLDLVTLDINKISI